MAGGFCEARQRICDFADHRSPIAAGPLSEQARCRIPGAILAIEEPAPVRNEGEHDPDGLSHGAGEVCHGGIDGNDKVEVGNGACGLREVG